MLHRSGGGKLGLLSIEDAIKKSQDLSLDVVQVSPVDAEPVYAS